MRTPDRPLREIFVTAAEIEDPSAREAFLDEACGDDASLRSRVEQLLAAESNWGAPPEKPPSAPRIFDPSPGTRMGPYTLREKIGEGGCGVVFMAEQEKPVRRKVALKIIKLGMDTQQVVARFEAERQALAMMDHPSIAHVYDAGTTETGRPYFVMELIRGVRITDYCDEKRLTTPERLELFLQVCQAVQHAHQKGIIHRDLKPSNILVTELDGRPLPKVIDFGIATAVEGRLTDQTLFTFFEQLLGTPAYMSPEQTSYSANRIDTRSDVYSLGVLLYELLTGQPPFDSKQLVEAGIDELRKAIKETEPPRPSMRLTQMGRDALGTIAHLRNGEPPRLVHQVRGDLDWIVMRCLEKAPHRRYETASSLAQDVQRHLGDEPIAARPPSHLYLLKKSIRRHKVAYCAALMITMALSIGLVAAAWQYREKSAALVRAVDAEAEQNRLRLEAEAQAERLRRRNYASDMNAAKRALDLNDLRRLRHLLDRHRPDTGQEDLRGWEWRYLWAQSRGEAKAQLAFRNSQLISLDSSPDGRWLATGAAHGGGLLLLPLDESGETLRLAENSERVQAAFSPTEPLLAFTAVEVKEDGRREAMLHLWDTQAKRLLSTHALDTDATGLVFSEDGKRLVTSTRSTSESEKGTLTVWQMPEAVRLRSMPVDQLGYELSPQGFTATRDLRYAAFSHSGPQHRVVLVDLEKWQEVTLENAEVPMYITALSFSQDGTQLAASNFGESHIRLWELPSGRLQARLEGHEAFVSALEFSADGQQLISGSADRTIGVWDVASRQRRRTLVGHELTVWRVHLLQDQQTLISGGKDGSVLLWDLSKPALRTDRIDFPDPIRDWTFANEGRSIVIADEQGKVRRWSGHRYQTETEIFSMPSQHTFGRNRVFSEDGRHLAMTNTSGDCLLVDLEQPRQRKHFPNRGGPAADNAFFIGNQWLVLPRAPDETIAIADIESGRIVLQSPALPGVTTGIYNSGQGYFAQIAFNQNLRLNHLDDSPIKDLKLRYHEAGWAASFSPDGRLLAIPSFLGYVRIWDTHTWEEVRTIDSFLLGVNSAGFSPDGRRMLVGGEVLKEEALRLFDTTNWLDVLTLDREGTHFSRTLFSPDGNAVGTEDTKGQLTIWTAPTWEAIATEESRTGAWLGHSSH